MYPTKLPKIIIFIKRNFVLKKNVFLQRQNNQVLLSFFGRVSYRGS